MFWLWWQVFLLKLWRHCSSVVYDLSCVFFFLILISLCSNIPENWLLIKKSMLQEMAFQKRLRCRSSGKVHEIKLKRKMIPRTIVWGNPFFSFWRIWEIPENDLFFTSWNSVILHVTTVIYGLSLYNYCWLINYFIKYCEMHCLSVIILPLSSF